MVRKAFVLIATKVSLCYVFLYVSVSLQDYENHRDMKIASPATEFGIHKILFRMNVKTCTPTIINLENS